MFIFDCSQFLVFEYWNESLTEGASIVFQVNHKGLNSKHWFIFSDPVNLTEGDTLTAIAHRIGFKESKPSERINR